jgi:phosphoribosyl 1,2-cyclic phosphodiesterase
MAAFVKFWGTRGSIPTPASWTRVYGGNTPCVEVRFDDTIFICDAGSGIRELGKDLLTRQPRPKRLHLMISHTHWDHIQGFPFFAPAYLKTMRINVYGQNASDTNAYQLLSGQMGSSFFPVSFKQLGAKIVADSLHDGEKKIGGVLVRSFAVNHPGGCLGYSFEKDGTKIVYMTDNELEIAEEDIFPDEANISPLRRMPEELTRAVAGADLAIFDAQFDEKQYAARKKWGHSTCFSTTDLAIRAQAKNLALFHHDPESTDAWLDQKTDECRKRAARLGADLQIFPAREGVELKF